MSSLGHGLATNTHEWEERKRISDAALNHVRALSSDWLSKLPGDVQNQVHATGDYSPVRFAPPKKETTLSELLAENTRKLRERVGAHIKNESTHARWGGTDEERALDIQKRIRENAEAQAEAVRRKNIEDAEAQLKWARPECLEHARFRGDHIDQKLVGQSDAASYDSIQRRHSSRTASEVIDSALQQPPDIESALKARSPAMAKARETAAGFFKP